MTQEEQAERVEAFWRLARFHARLNAAPSYFGPTALESVPPPTWAWGDDGAEADAFAERVVSDGEAEVSAAVGDYDGVELPTAGTLSILCDGSGRPRALLQVTHVEERGDQVVERSRVVYAGH